MVGAISAIDANYEDEADAGNDWQSNLAILDGKIAYYRKKQEELDNELSNPAPSYRETKYDNQREKIAGLEKVIKRVEADIITTAENMLPIAVWSKIHNAGDNATTIVKLELLIGKVQGIDQGEVDITVVR